MVDNFLGLPSPPPEGKIRIKANLSMSKNFHLKTTTLF